MKSSTRSCSVSLLVNWFLLVLMLDTCCLIIIIYSFAMIIHHVHSFSGAELIALKPEDDNRYLAFSVAGPFGKDTLEFLVKPSTTSSRNWEGDAETPIITYRAIAGVHEI